MNKSFFKNESKNYLYIFIGAIILAIAVVTFLAPNRIAPGGTPGIAVIISHLSGLQLGLLMFMINAPIILISIKFINKSFALRTIFAIITSSFSVDFFREFLGFKGLIIDPILASIYGGILVGIALGLIIRGNASAGGPAVVSRLIAQKTHFKEHHILILLDAIIVTTAGFIFKNIETTLLSLITVYVSARGLDLVLSGRAMYKMVHISTKKAEILSMKLVEKMGIKGSIVDGRELDIKENKQILLLLIESNRIIELKHIVQENDNESFIVIGDASEILGRGHN